MQPSVIVGLLSRAGFIELHGPSILVSIRNFLLSGEDKKGEAVEQCESPVLRPGLEVDAFVRRVQCAASAVQLARQ